MKKFISSLLCFILFISYLLVTINICFSNLFDKSNIKKVVSKINITAKVESEDMNSESLSIEDYFTNLYKIAADYDISENQVNKYINSDETKAFISKYIEKFSNNILKKDNFKITNEFLEQELKNSVDEYVKENDFSNHTKQRMKNFVNNNSHKIIENLPTTEQIESYIDIPMINYIQLFLSNTARIILLCSILISVILIIIINLKDIKFLKYLSITLLISNLVTLIFGFMIKPSFTLIIGYNSNLILTLLKGFINTILIDYLIISGIGILISIILLILYKVFNKK